MERNGIEVREYGAVSSDVVLLVSNKLDSSSTPTITSVNGVDSATVTNGTAGSDNDLIWVDPSACCYALFTNLEADKVLLEQSPLALAKALKVNLLFCFIYLFIFNFKLHIYWNII